MGYREIEIEYKEYNNRFNDYYMELLSRADKRMTRNFAEMRSFKMSTVEELGIFYIGDSVEMLIPKFMDYIDEFGVISPTNRKPIFHNRYVIPIRDANGDILNLVGYSPEANERYVYGTAKYYRRREDLYGLENLHKAYECGYAILTEGITDTIALRNIGYEVSFANCGTHGNSVGINQLNRCRYGVVRVPDRDEPGIRAARKWKFNRYITLNTFVAYKDIDEMIKNGENGESWVRSYMEDCIRWIKQKEHSGFDCEKQEVTMY